MKKALKFIVPGVCILVVVITFAILFDLQNKVEEVNYGTENIADDMVDEEWIENTITEEENILVDNTTIVENSENVIEDDYVTNPEEDELSNVNQESATDLVKKYWGEDNTVYFTNEGTNSNGEYIVAVRQKTSTTVKSYFKVNLETKTVEIDY